MTDFSSMSIANLKKAALDNAAAQDANLRQSTEAYQRGSQLMEAASTAFQGHVTTLSSSWQGAAADAASNNANATLARATTTEGMASAWNSMNSSYAQDMRSQRAQMQAVPEPDTSLGYAAAHSAGWGPLAPAATAYTMYEQQQKYNKAQQQAAQIATQMDSSGQMHADDSRSTPWAQRSTVSDPPPSSLPPVPSTSGGGGPTYNGPTVRHTGGGIGYTPMTPGPGTTGSDAEILNNGVKGHGNTNNNQGTLTETTPQGSGGGHGVTIPTTSQGAGAGATGTAGAGGPGAVEQVPVTGGGAGGGAAAAGVLGGAGLLGAGALGTRGGLGGRGAGLAEGEGGLRGRGGALAEGEGRLGGRGGAGLAEGEAGRGGGLAEGEGRLGGLRGGGVGEGEGLPRGSRLGGMPEQELAAERRGMLRGGVPEGFMGEPVAGEAGRMGGYPAGGGAGSRRRDDDEEAPVPDYLVETEDVWGDGTIAAPPVIGE